MTTTVPGRSPSASVTIRTAWPVPRPAGPCTTTSASGRSRAAPALTWSRPWLRRRDEALRAEPRPPPPGRARPRACCGRAANAAPSGSADPHPRTLARGEDDDSDRGEVGSTAAESPQVARLSRRGLRRDPAFAGPPRKTGRDASGSGGATAHVFTRPSSAGYRPAAMIGWPVSVTAPKGFPRRDPLPPGYRAPTRARTDRPDQPGSFPADFVTAGDWPFPACFGRPKCLLPHFLGRVRRSRWARGRHVSGHRGRASAPSGSRQPLPAAGGAGEQGRDGGDPGTGRDRERERHLERPSWNGAVIRCRKNWRR